MIFRSLLKKNIILIVCLFFSLSGIISIPSYGFSLNDLLGGNHSKAKIRSVKSSIEQQRFETRKKIIELKKRERVEIGKLYVHQSHMEETKQQLNAYENKLDNTKTKLNTLQSELGTLSNEQQKTAYVAGERLKQIYKGERVSILHLIFAANDVNTFLDRVYYQKRLAKYDKNLLNDLRTKTTMVAQKKQQVEYEKSNIIGTIGVINEKKKQIAASINTSQYLISKLRTDRATYESSERELARRSAQLEAMLRRSMSKTKEIIQTTAGFIRPIMGRITSPFGWRRHPIFGSRSFHTGVDIAGPYSTAIHASNSGKVIYTGWYGGYGKVVIINHGNYQGQGTSTLYAHMSGIATGVGSYVNKGQVIGYEGTTGYSTGPHLHFEVRLNGRPTNPLNYIP